MAIEDEIRDLKHEVQELRGTNDSLRTTVAVQAQELDTLRIEAVLLRSMSRRDGLKSESMKTLMTTMSAMLLQGLKRMEERDREERMRAQEDRLGVGDDDMPPITGFRRQMETADKSTPVRRSMHLGGNKPTFPGEYEFQVIHDLDGPDAWMWRASSEAWRLLGPERPTAPPTPPEPTPAATAERSTVRSEPIPEKSPSEYFAPPGTVMRPKAGTMRTDIIDKRLPPVVLDADSEDQRDLAALAEGVLKEPLR